MLLAESRRFGRDVGVPLDCGDSRGEYRLFFFLSGGKRGGRGGGPHDMISYVLYLEQDLYSSGSGAGRGEGGGGGGGGGNMKYVHLQPVQLSSLTRFLLPAHCLHRLSVSSFSLLPLPVWHTSPFISIFHNPLQSISFFEHGM